VFETVTQRPRGRLSKRAGSIFGSAALHAAVAAVAIYVSVRVVAVKEEEPVDVTFFAAAPPPPPPPAPKAPPPPPPPKKPPSSKPKVAPAPVAQLVAPTEVPEEKPPENPPEDIKEEDDVEEDYSGGSYTGEYSGVAMPGGVPGGTGTAAVVDEPAVILSAGMTKPRFPPDPHTCGEKPQMPETARTMGIEGLCLVKLKVGSRGDVSVAQVIKCPSPILEEAIRKWASFCRAEPATQDGKPMAVYVMQPIRFALTR
jgi:protein TonB